MYIIEFYTELLPYFVYNIFCLLEIRLREFFLKICDINDFGWSFFTVVSLKTKSLCPVKAHILGKLIYLY